MINDEKSNFLEYEEINQKIKDNLINKYKSFNKAEKSRYFIPLTNKEIQKEFNKEYNRILNSLKNKIKLDIKDIKNEIKYFKLNNYIANDIKSNILKSNYESNSLSNKIKFLRNDTIFTNNLMKKYLKEESLVNMNLISKNKQLLDNIEENNKALSSIEKNQYEIKQYYNAYIEKQLSNKNLLNTLRKKFESFVEEFNNTSLSNNKETFNKFEKCINSIKNKIEDIQNDINIIKNNIEELKKNEKHINEVTNMKNLVNNNLKFESNKIYNKVEQIMVNIQNLENNSINNINKINDYNDKVIKIHQIAKIKEEEINNLKISFIAKNDIEEIIKEINEIKTNSELVNKKRNNNEIELEKLNKEKEKIKKIILNCTNKKEYFEYLNNFNKKLEDISSNYNEKMKLIEKESKKINELLENDFQAQKDSIIKLKEEENNIMEEISKIKMLLEEHINKMNILKQNKFKLNLELGNINEKLKKLNMINDNINKNKNEIKDIDAKILDLEKNIRNESIENYECRNSVLKNLNNCIYENNKNMNEIIKKGLINKNKKNNLLIMLNDLEKNIINHKKYFDDLIDNFIDKQNKINQRNEQDINYFINNKEIKINIEKINKIENKIDEMSGKYNKLIDKIIEGKEQVIDIKKGELLEFQKNVNKEFNEIELYIDDKISNYKKEDSNSNNSNFNIN